MLGFMSLVPPSMMPDTFQQKTTLRTPSLPSSSDGQPSWLLRTSADESPGCAEVSVSKISRCENNSCHLTADVAQLASRVQRRLAQNRAAARKCRQKKKHYLHQLEQEVATLRRTSDQEHLLTEAAARSGAFAKKHIASATLSQKLCELQKLQDKQCRTAQNIRQCLDACAPLAQLKRLVDEALCELQSVSTIKEEMFNGPDMLLLAAGEHLPAAQRMMCWMGGVRPTEMLKLMTEEWHLESLSSQQEYQLSQLGDEWHQQEEAISKGFEALRADVLSFTCTHRGHFQDDGGVPPQLQGKLGAMRMLLLEALELHHRVLSTIEPIVNVRQFAALLIKPMELCINLQKVWDRLHLSSDNSSFV